ncbi:hypothetical protein D3C73_1184100 [compost metagenome]
MCSEEAVGFIDQTVLADYELLVESGERYYRDAEFFEHLLAGFSQEAGSVRSSIRSMAGSIGEITQVNAQFARDTQAIAERASGVLEKSRTVATAATRTEESADELRNGIARFEV